MVSKKIVVESKSIHSDKSYIWESDGASGYSISEGTKKDNGTTITLYMKDDTEDYSYSDYLTEYKIRSLVTKYSDYISYPIKMEVTKDDKKEEETLNSMIPLWKKSMV
jgi:molecular chaperone HtpG